MTAAVLPNELPPAAYDESYDRHYLPLPGGVEVQTKGRGSSFRVVVGIGTPDEHRLNIPDQPYLHETIERMARDIRASVAVLAEKLAESERVCAEQVSQLAQCFKLAGADDDGAADSLIAPRAVEAVRELREDYNEACDEIAKLKDDLSNEAAAAAFDRMRN